MAVIVLAIAVVLLVVGVVNLIQGAALFGLLLILAGLLVGGLANRRGDHW